MLGANLPMRRCSLVRPGVMTESIAIRPGTPLGRGSEGCAPADAVTAVSPVRVC